MGGGDESGEELLVCASMSGLERRRGASTGILGGDDVNDGPGPIIMRPGVISGRPSGTLSLGLGNGVRPLDSGGSTGFSAPNEAFADSTVGGPGACSEFSTSLNVTSSCGPDVSRGVAGCANGSSSVGSDDSGLTEAAP